jgi:hypothetical protein
VENLERVADYSEAAEQALLSRSRTSLLVKVALLGAGLIGGCTHSPVVPPPAASIPPQRPAATGIGGIYVPSLPSTPPLTTNPWKPTAPPREWKYIVVHHTATETGSVETIHAAHLKNKDKNGNPWLGIGYHFVIGNGHGMSDGAIEPTFRWRTQIQGAHAGSANKDYNERGIGICLVGNFEKTPPTPAQRQSVKLLVNTLKSNYLISAPNVVGHKDIRATSTECPGRLFPMAEVAADELPVFTGVNLDGARPERVAQISGSTLR